MNKSKFTNKRRAIILDAVASGATYQLAAKAANITARTLEIWRKKGEDEPDSEYAVFLAEFEMAEGRTAVKWLKLIDQAAAGGTWQAAAWKLERRYPSEYGRTVTQQEHTGKDGGPIQIVAADMSDDELARIAADKKDN